MPPEFNPSFGQPAWSWLIVLYFFVGGLTGGIYVAAAWLDFLGDDRDRSVLRTAHLLAFPLILVCAVLLIADLGRPDRFWHMIFQSERLPLPILKLWSPMSLGSLVLGIYGAISFISFLDALLTRGRDRWLHAPGHPLGRVISVLGALTGLVLAGYTGALLSVSNMPVWANSNWITALFLFSGVSTGVSAIVLLARRAGHSTLAKLEEADNYLMGLELVTLLIFLGTLGAVGARFILATPVVLLFALVIVLGLLLPLLLHWRPRLLGSAHRASPVAAALVLLGGLVLRWAVLAGPQGLGL